MERFTVTVDGSGRVLIPAKVRKQLKLQQGSELIATLDKQQLVLNTRAEALRRAQEYFSQFRPKGTLWSDEIIETAARKRAVNLRTEYVLDSSAVIAVLSLEPGHEAVKELLGKSAISAVNLAEIANKLAHETPSVEAVRELLAELELTVVDWSEDMAYRSTEFTRSFKEGNWHQSGLLTNRMASRLAIAPASRWPSICAPQPSRRTRPGSACHAWASVS